MFVPAPVQVKTEAAPASQHSYRYLRYDFFSDQSKVRINSHLKKTSSQSCCLAISKAPAVPHYLHALLNMYHHLKISGPVAAVLLPMLPDPLLADLVEAVAVVATLLHLGDRLGQDLGKDGQEGEDGRPRHELGQLQ